MGPGFSACRRILEAQRGRIWAESDKRCRGPIVIPMDLTTFGIGSWTYESLSSPPDFLVSGC